MTDFINQLLFSASITGPICLMIGLGVFLKRVGMINDEFINIASKLVFQVTLPALLFLSIIHSDHSFSNSANLIIYGLIANCLFYLFTAFSTKLFFQTPKQRGVVIQGSFRANTGIIALAYVANAYGDNGIALGALYVASTTLLYNVLSVIALAPIAANPAEGKTQALRSIVKTLTKNPLILSILAGLVVSNLHIPIPDMVSHAGQYFADMTLPLALLCTGGSLDISSLKSDKHATWFASAYKLILCPLFITLGGYWFGFKGMDLGLIFFMSAAPTAAASYIMARSMGGNAVLAANIIALTSVISLLTYTVGIVILSSLQLL